MKSFSLPNSSVENGQLSDPAHWGVADVVNYFKATGFEEQANAFQDQVGICCHIPQSYLLHLSCLFFFVVFFYKYFYKLTRFI